MRVKWKLAVASFKMFYRQREAILWTVLFPVFIIVLFGFVRFDSLGSVDLGIVNDAGNSGGPLVTALRGVSTFKVTEGTRESELGELEKGERDMVLVIPARFGDSASSASVTAFTNDERRQEAQIGTLVLQRVLDEMALERSPVPGRVVAAVRPVKSRNLSYIDFLIPGVVAMSIMQMGIFGVAFGFVSLKKRGILRRLWVTPINPNDFIIAQVFTRVIILMVQMSILIGVGILFLHLHFTGSIGSMLVLGLLGAVIFLGMGFALAGISKSEDQVAPLANVISLPMMLLSGVFFNRSHLPGLIHTVTGFFPLTYLADGMRGVAIDGASLFSLWPQLAGLLIWCMISVAVAVKLFRWE
jgi:ABC-2 type transport system permease protein